MIQFPLAGLDEVRNHAKLGLWKETWQLLRDLSAPVRDSVEGRRLLLECCLNLGKWEVGRACAQSLLAMDPHSRAEVSLFMVALAWDAHQRGDDFTARESFRIATALDPDALRKAAARSAA